MKVLHIIWSSYIGGIESVVLNLAISQQLSGHVKPALFVAKSEGPLIEKAKLKNIEIVRGKFKKGSINFSKINECIKLFRQFDILHLHAFNPIIAYAAIQSKRKIVFTEHGNFAFERKQSWTESISKKLQQVFLNRFVNHITFNSEFSKATAIARYQLNKRPLNVVYNGVELPLSDDYKTKSTRSIRIGFVGRLVEVKRVDRLIEVFSKISDKSKFKLELIGDGPQKATILKQITDNKLNATIELHGFKNELSDYYNQWHLLIAPSTNEAFGLVAIEAYAHGCAVAVFADGGGLAELVNQCEPKMVFKTTTELSKFVESLVDFPEAINETMLRKNRKAFAQQFSIERMEQAINQVYLSL